MEEIKKRKISECDSDSDCVIIPAFLVNAGHTMNESEEEEEDSKDERKKLIKKSKRDIKPKEEESDSSVEIVDVKLPYEKDVQEKLNKPTQDLDTLSMWDRLVQRENDKEMDGEYDAE